MSLIDRLRERLGRGASSFQLMGEDLALLPGAALAQAGDAYRAELAATVPAALQPRFEAEQAAALADAHRWLTRYNKSLHGRIAGYLALGQRLDFAYPWPVVAILGLCQVMRGMRQNRIYGLLAPLLGRAGLAGLDRMIDASDDVLRRTNRGIFADSLPTVLYGLRIHELRRDGDAALAQALAEGPLPPLMDAESRALAVGLAAGLALAEPARRFSELAALTLRHFGREQAIFTHHMGAPRPPSARPGRLDRLMRLAKVPAPRIARGRRGPHLAFADYALPAGFDVRDHDARVAAFGAAFVTSVTASPEDYQIARDWVLARFGGASIRS